MCAGTAIVLPPGVPYGGMDGMNLNRSQFRRLAELDRAIRRGRYPNCSSFAKKWEVSRKTVQRDINFLKESLRAPVAYDAERKGYYYTVRSWVMPGLDLTEGELLQLLLAERMARQYSGTPVAATLESLFDKICAALPDRITIDPADFQTQFTFFGQPARRITEKVWMPVFRSLRAERVLRIRYRSYDAQKPERRDIEPIHLACMTGEWYLVAHCRLRDELRHFALARIESAELTKEYFEPREFDPAAYFENRFGRFVGEAGKSHKVEVRFTKSVAQWVLEKTWHPKQKVKKHKDGKITLCFPAPALFEVKRWVLQWGKDARVLAPKELRQDVAKEARALAVTYRGKQR